MSRDQLATCLRAYLDGLGIPDAPAVVLAVDRSGLVLVRLDVPAADGAVLTDREAVEAAVSTGRATPTPAGVTP